MKPKPGRRVLSQPSSGNQRIPCAAVCDIQDGLGGLQTCRIWNVSVAGVYLAIQPFVKVAEPLTLSFCLPGDTVPIRLQGRVAWWNPPSAVRGVGELAPHLPPGCGVQYLDAPTPIRARIEARVKQATSDGTKS